MYYDGYEQLKDALLTMDRLLDEMDKKSEVQNEENNIVEKDIFQP